MRATEVNRSLRDHLRIPHSKRVKSDPLVLLVDSPLPHLFLWIQVSRDGWVVGLGNKLVPTICLGSSDRFALGTGTNVRVGRLLDDAQRIRATTIHNELVARPLPEALLAKLPADVTTHLRQEFRPRDVPFSEHDDLWLRYRAPADLLRWSDFLNAEWPQILSRAEATLAVPVR